MCSCITNLNRSNYTTLVCGDFNFPRIQWNDISVNNCDNESCSGLFYNFCLANSLHQFVHDATRLTSSTSNVLDLILCNDLNFVFNVNVATPFSSCDHCVVNCNIIMESNVYEMDDIVHYDFDHADWESIQAYLYNFDFDALFVGCADVSNTFNSFYQVLRDCISLYVPCRIYNNKHKAKTKYPASIRKSLQRKNTAWRLYKKFRTPATLNKYKSCAARCRHQVREFTRQRENDVINSGNLGKFFRYANKKLSVKSAVGPLKQANGSITTNPVVKAELLQSVFSSKFTTDNNIIPPITPVPGSGKMSHVVFSPPLIKRVIRKMRTNAKAGPDAIPPKFYKTCCDELSLPLSFLFQLSFHHGFLPPDWLTAYITPAHKKGDTTDPNNYRPIALTCTLCKIMETVIKDQLLQYVAETIDK